MTKFWHCIEVVSAINFLIAINFCLNTVIWQPWFASVLYTTYHLVRLFELCDCECRLLANKNEHLQYSLNDCYMQISTACQMYILQSLCSSSAAFTHSVFTTLYVVNYILLTNLFLYCVKKNKLYSIQQQNCRLNVQQNDVPHFHLQKRIY